MGYTTNSHYKAIYSDFLAQQFIQGIVSTGFSTEKEQELIAAVSKQSRDYYYLTIPIESQKNSIEPSDKDIKSYYENHLAEFMTSEQVMIEYIELRSSDLLKEISVDADLVEKRYQEKIDIASSSTLYRAAHILLDRKDDGSHMAKMATIQDQLKNKEDFSSLAIAYSDDFLTSEKGGDLGYLSPGDLSSELDLVLGQLSVGAVSEIVETKAGIHLLKLIEIKAAEIPNRDELEPSIREDLRLQMAKDLMPEKIEELKELAYGAASLVGVANTMGLDLKISGLFSRSGGDGILADKQVIEASFGSSVLEDGYASDVIELSDDHVLVLSVREHSPSEVQSLFDVSSTIKQIIQYDIAADKLFSYGAKLKERVRSGESIESVAGSENLPWEVSFNSKIDENNAASNLKKMFIFTLPLPDAKPVVGHLIMPNGDYVLTALSKVTLGNYGTLRLAEKNIMSSSRSTATASRDYGAYISLLLEGADIASD
jgi:peptidyl-prolyl cis-trans isomerase D